MGKSNFKKFQVFILKMANGSAYNALLQPAINHSHLKKYFSPNNIIFITKKQMKNSKFISKCVKFFYTFLKPNIAHFFTWVTTKIIINFIIRQRLWLLL